MSLIRASLPTPHPPYCSITVENRGVASKAKCCSNEHKKSTNTVIVLVTIVVSELGFRGLLFASGFGWQSRFQAFQRAKAKAKARMAVFRFQ